MKNGLITQHKKTGLKDGLLIKHVSLFCNKTNT